MTIPGNAALWQGGAMVLAGLLAFVSGWAAIKLKSRRRAGSPSAPKPRANSPASDSWSGAPRIEGHQPAFPSHAIILTPVDGTGKMLSTSINALKGSTSWPDPFFTVGIT